VIEKEEDKKEEKSVAKPSKIDHTFEKFTAENPSLNFTQISDFSLLNINLQGKEDSVIFLVPPRLEEKLGKQIFDSFKTINGLYNSYYENRSLNFKYIQLKSFKDLHTISKQVGSELTGDDKIP